jgi:hypothetical protein
MAGPFTPPRPPMAEHQPPMASPVSPRKRRRLTLPERPLLLNDRLGKLISQSVVSLSAAPSWASFVRRSRGLPHIAAHVADLPHQAAAYLENLRQRGADVVFDTPQWTAAHLQRCLERGPHASATDHADFVRDEMADFIEKGFWTVLPFDLVKQFPNLRLSPLGVVPQRERRPRLIVDLSFYGVNADTVRQAPPEAMQFGRTLERLLATIRHADPAYGPVQIIKVDIADGFYRVGLVPDSAPGLGVILPRSPGEPYLVAIPLVLPMGWVESPPQFCAVTETAADLANRRVRHPWAPPHRLESMADVAATADHSPVSPLLVCVHPSAVPPFEPSAVPPFAPPAHRTLQAASRPVASVDVYVDDFIAIAQGSARTLRTVRRHLLHAIDDVFSPLAADDKFGNEPISVKKLRKGDASWDTLKVVLGWLVDTVRQTIALPPHRSERLLTLFHEMRDRKRVSVKRWQCFLGELRSMVLAIPGGKGLFSTLQHGFKYTDKHRIRLSPSIRDHLDDFEELAHSVAARPTRLAEIIPDSPTFIGACDASRRGMGGVWFLPDGSCCVWRQPFPLDIQDDIITATHMTGTITNSDLELAGILGHQDVLTALADVREHTLALLNDNFPAIVRCRKGSITSDGVAAYLLRLNSLHQRHHRYLTTYDHIAGPANCMADDASRLFHLSDHAFLAHFHQHYPQPLPWQLCPLPPAMNFALISALRKQRLAPRLFLNVNPPKTGLGRFGNISAPSWASLLSSRRSTTPSLSSKSSPNDTAMADSLKARSASALAPWSRRSVTLARRWPGWGPPILASSAPATSISV